MKLKICPSNRDAIEAALLAVNGRATAFTITTFETVQWAANEAETTLNTIAMPKNRRQHTRHVFRPRGPQANAYGNSAISTLITMVRGTSDWFLVSVDRATVHPKQGPWKRTAISETARNAALRALAPTIEVVPTSQEAAA